MRNQNARADLMITHSDVKLGGLARWPLAPASVVIATIGVAAAVALAPGLWHMFMLLLVSPIVEETVFRMGLQEELLRRCVQPWLANIATALAFFAAHALVRGADQNVLWFALPAVAVGIAYDRWRSLPICVALHAAMNALWLVGGGRLMP